ncbi:MAG: conjugal transfer protein TraX [Oscillospiraceae bacterium]|nr:conjugal transfer protein TraX [Oscillospiraceae bacterium]
MNAKIKGISANGLKLIAMFTMLTDHIAWKFAPFASAGGFAAHLAGRIAIPVFCFFVAEGYFHTRNIKKYFRRMLIFAVISNFAFYYYEYGRFPRNAIDLLNSISGTSVILPLMLGLAALYLYYNENLNSFLKAALIFLCAALAVLGDWFCFPVIWILGFGIFRGDFKKQAVYFALTAFPIMAFEPFFRYYKGYGDELWALNQIGVLLALPLLYFYNGKLGKYKMKWLFYIFYPAHLFAIAVISKLLMAV